MNEEIWADIPQYEGKYQASDLGNVRSLNYRHTGEAKVMKPRLTRDGYLRVHLYKNGKGKCVNIHSLVVTAFKGPIPPGMQVNHINEDKCDNRLENLEVVTPKQNMNHGTRIERAVKAISKALKGKSLSAEHRAKISAARKGRPSGMKGKKLSEETKAKMRASQKARHQREKRGNYCA